MKNFPRRYRVASVLQEALAPIVAGIAADGMVTLRRIILNSDFSVATVVYAVVGCDRAVAQARLDESATVFRLRLARRLNMRKTPKLIFCHDDAGLAADEMRRFLESVDSADD